eukprot:1176263-Prorocentrum_minimum.AAC.1
MKLNTVACRNVTCAGPPPAAHPPPDSSATVASASALAPSRFPSSGRPSANPLTVRSPGPNINPSRGSVHQRRGSIHRRRGRFTSGGGQFTCGGGQFTCEGGIPHLAHGGQIEHSRGGVGAIGGGLEGGGGESACDVGLLPVALHAHASRAWGDEAAQQGVLRVRYRLDTHRAYGIYSHDRPIRRRKCGYILTTDQSDTHRAKHHVC